ncbi:MAG: hypothetical protein LUG12_07760 [Erysipelotrichaceae bacterium]|nr:hypothetical protein [Erysipelotrichaceae bacterium]
MIVKPILEEYGFKGTCFVIKIKLESSNENPLKRVDIVNTDNVVYYSHSYSLHITSKGFDKKSFRIYC